MSAAPDSRSKQTGFFGRPLLKDSHALDWRELLARFALGLFCIALWHNGLFYGAISILALAWLVDGGLCKLDRLLKQPLVWGILAFCGAWLLGLLWSDFPVAFEGKWKKYFILLTFIPFLALLDKNRWPWAVGALLSGYASILALGSYQWAIEGAQGIPWLKFSYLGYSAAIGAGVILAAFYGCVAATRSRACLSWLLALLLLFLQFNQSSRGLLIATLAALLLMLVLRYRIEGRKLMASLAAAVVAIAVLAASSDVLHERLYQAGNDLRLFQQGHYQTSLGYRLAMWEIGLRGIAERPLLGHGAGMAREYFDERIVTHQQGIYRNLPEFQKTIHFHNEWIEIGVHLGLLGISAWVFLLWCWFQAFKRCQMSLLGAAMVCYIVIAGLSHVFLLFSRIPPLLLVITALAICWRQQQLDESDTMDDTSLAAHEATAS
ncbi:MAG TPA: O-antigen ligase family protein [Nitrosomonas halophila]|nr:O-antigen ligase family protein [Nitrosomonas halophila]